MAKNDFAGSFALGLVNGYIGGKKQQQQQERNELELDRLRDDKAMRDAFKAIDQNVSPTEAFAVPLPDGTMASAATMDAAKELAGGNVDPAGIAKVFLVGGKQYASKELADDAASVLNSPANRMRRQADVARQFGRPDMASALMRSYKDETEANRQVVFDNFQRMRAAGDPQGILDMYNNRPGATGKISLEQGPDGSLTLMTKVGDKVTPGQKFASADDFYEGFGNLITSTPDNVFERSLAKKNYGLAVRRQDESERHNQVAEGISAGNLGVASAGLDLRRKELSADEDRRNNPAPTIGFGVNASNERVPIVFGSTRGKDGAWNSTATALDPLTGVQPSLPRTGGLDLSGLLGNQGGFVFDGSKIPPKAPAAAPVQPLSDRAVSGAVDYSGRGLR